MKTALLILLLAAGAFAQELKDPIRIVNAQRVNLQPLFTWWTNAAMTSATNASKPEEQRQPLPERPLRAWVRITSSELTNTGFAWIARAQIQEIPDGPVTEQIVVLRHGPFEEKKILDRAVANYNQATESRETASNIHSASLERAAAFNHRANLYSEMYYIDPHRNWNFGYAADDYYRAASRARRDANNAAQRMNQLEARRAELSKITQGRSTLTVDTFALRTAETYQGLLVLDIGLRFGR